MGNKGWGGKGKGGKKGSGKGKGAKGGIFDLDVMGGSYNGEWYGSYGGQDDWNQGSDNSGYGLRSLATLGAAAAKPKEHFENENRFAALSGDKASTFVAPLSDFIRPNRAPGKARRITEHKKMFKPQCDCSSGECGHPCDEVRPELTSALVPNRETVGVATPAAVPSNASTSTMIAEEKDTEDWNKVGMSRRGGRWRSDSLKPPSSILQNSQCSCPSRSEEYFCASAKCRNDQSRWRPNGSVTIGHVVTDEGSPKSTINPPRIEAPLQPKPKADVPAKGVSGNKSANSIPALLDYLKSTLSKTSSSTNFEILDALKRAGEAMDRQSNIDYWLTDTGQADLLRRYEATARPPTSEAPPSSSKINGLCVFDYTAESKAMLSAASPAGSQSDWIEVELTADTGACDTVIPRKLCESIPIRPSLQSLRGMEYEVADGRNIPNLGERHCLMWTEDAREPRRINMQVADVHKALLSLSRCADMGFESRFGRTMGALIDEETGEVVPLRRKGNLYVLRCWLKAAPFGRQEQP
jgi:hypothetical protein